VTIINSTYQNKNIVIQRVCISLLMSRHCVQAFVSLDCRPDGLLIKHPHFLDVLIALNVEPHNIFLLTVWHCRLCFWTRDFRNCM